MQGTCQSSHLQPVAERHEGRRQGALQRPVAPPESKQAKHNLTSHAQESRKACQKQAEQPFAKH